MAKPPEDVSPSELFLKLQQRPRPSEVVDFPRKDHNGKPIGKVRIQVLSAADHTKAQLAGQEALKKKIEREDRGLPTVEAIAGDLVARELLAQACVVEENRGTEAAPYYPRVFPSADAVGEYLEADEVAMLFSLYIQAQHKWGPMEKTIDTEEELSIWIRRLVEGAREFPLSRISSVHWAEVASLLARRAYTLSVILECLYESLPISLQSRLKIYSLGTSFFGARASKTTEDGSEDSIDLRPVLMEAPLSIDDAKALALKFREGSLAKIDQALDEAEEDS